MPELLTPGVFVQEVEFGPQPIEGVSTSTAGFVGETERGVENKPTLVTSFADYSRKFGGFFGETKYLPLAVRGFFENGGRRAFIVRVTGSGALESSAAVRSGYEVAMLSGPQASAVPGNCRQLKVSTVVGVQVDEDVQVFSRIDSADTLTVTVKKIDAAMSTVDVEAASIAALAQLDKAKAATHAVRYTTAVGAAGTSVIEFKAKDKGAYGDRVQVLLVPAYGAVGQVKAIITGGLVVNQIAPFKVNQVVEIENAAGGARAYSTVTSVDVTSSSVTLTLPASFTPVVNDAIRVTGWRLQVLFDGQPVEAITDIPSRASDLAEMINQTSQWVKVTATATAPSVAVGAVTGAGTVSFPLFRNGQPVNLGSGSNGTLVPLDVVGTETGGVRTGLKALEAQDGISLIAAPGQTSDAVVVELIGQAERLMDRFAVFESDATAKDVQTVLQERGKFNSKFAAMYYPWVKVLDPFTGKTIDVPPSGHVLGSYARTDNDRGVFKAPANVTLRGITGLSQIVVAGEQDLLNPAGVNVLRAFDGLGNVIWGTRTISSEGSWKYVPVRRLFIFIEQSIIRGTRFAVFEPNDQRLWAKLRDAVSNFLSTQWRAGALFGAKPEQAFFVRVDETTTTQDDRDNGRVNIIVGIAPVKPAEFVVFQIGQAPQSVIIAEQG